MNNRFNINHRSKRIISVLLALFMLAISPGAVAKAAGSGGLLKLTVTVSGLDINSGVEVIAEKEIDGIMTYYRNTTDLTGVVVFTIPFGGTVRVYGEPVSGYITPETTLSLTKLKGNLQKTCSLIYTPSQSDILVTGISIEPETATLFVGQTVQLNTTISPLNATNKLVSWESDAPAIASVDEGNVTALTVGSAEIIATTVDGSFTDKSTISIIEITSLNTLPEIPASPGSVTALPRTVTANLTGGGTYESAVLWSLPADAENISLSSTNGTQYLSLGLDATGLYSLSGDVDFTDLSASLDVSVLTEPAVPIVSASLNADTLSLYIGLLSDTATLTLDVMPIDADTSSLIWRSSNPLAVEIISVSNDNKSADIKGVSNGTSVISVILPGSPEIILDTCIVNVAADPLITDPAYISATMENDPTPVDQFSNKYEVWIRSYDLPDGTYFIRVTDKGNSQPLGIGQVDVNGTDSDLDGVMEFKYNLYDETLFYLTTKYSASYFVEMSMDPTFPSGDDEVTLLPKTFADNFKITSPVPTGQIVVNVFEEIGGIISLPSVQIIGKHVILCRETDLGTAAEYSDYILGYSEGHPVFSDEAKLIGHVQSDGSVLWDVPKEKLKIGGYILLMELNQSYTSNLNEINPNPLEEGLLKEVHILRNTTVYREIIVSNQGTP